MMSRPGTRSAVRTDGLGAAKLLIKTGVILSFLVLLTGLNYLSTGDTPILWSNGDVASISSDVAMNFYRRNLRSDEDNCTASNLRAHEDKCAFVRSECSSDGFIDYLEFYYCTARNPAGWILLVGLLLLYFYLLGGTAERFFCPALCRLASGLRMSPNVAGVTLLALGNGSNDIFSTIASVQQGSFGQALGALLGAGMFITSIVVGSVTIAAKGGLPTVTRRPFLRDLGFYVATLIVIFFICWDGKIRLWESILFILIYIIYVVTVIVGRFIYQRRKKLALKKLQYAATGRRDSHVLGSGQDDRSIDIYEENDGLSGPLRYTNEYMQPRTPFDDAAAPRTRKTKTGLRERMAKRMAAIGVYVSKIGFWRNKTNHELKREGRMTVARMNTIQAGEAAPSSMRSMRRPPGSIRQTVHRISDIPDISDSEDDGMKPTTTASETNDEEQASRATPDWGLTSVVDHRSLSTDEVSNDEMPEADEDDYLVEVDPLQPKHAIDPDAMPLMAGNDDYEDQPFGQDEEDIDISTCSGAIKVNWLNLKEIFEVDDITTLRKSIFFFVDLPRLIVQHLTIHFSEPDTYSRILYVLQPFGVATLLLTLFNGWTLHTALPGPLSAWIMPLAVIVSLIVYFTTNNEQPPIYEWLFIVSGLIMSVVWIYHVAQELVSILSAAGTILGISKDIMGLTVLAWGNSIGDMVSNVVISRKGFPQMALSACYAAPLSNTLLGLGIALTIQIVRLRSTFFSLESQLSNTVFWGFIFLITNLTTALIAVPLSKFTYFKLFGIGIILLYAAFTAISLLTEFKIIFRNYIIWDKWPGRH